MFCELQPQTENSFIFNIPLIKWVLLFSVCRYREMLQLHQMNEKYSVIQTLETVRTQISEQSAPPLFK